MILNCPPAASLTAIPLPTCAFKFDQMVRLAFERRQPTSAPPFATLADIQTLSNWTTKIAATDSTKVVISPLFAGMVIPSSEALTTGGNDNSTINGVPEYNGEGSVTVTGTFKNLPPATKRAMDLLAQESLAGSTGISNLTLYFMNRDGYIFPKNPKNGDVATTQYMGVPIYNFRIGSAGSEGLNAPNINPFSFSMSSDWADFLTSIKPAFDTLVDLNPISAIVRPTFTHTLTMTGASMADGPGFVTVNGAVDATHSFKYLGASDGTGSSTTMNIIVSGVQVAQVVYTSDRNGQACGWVSGGVTYYGTFASGNVAFTA